MEIGHQENSVIIEPHPEFFQWHYFDFSFDNGDVGSVVFLSRSPGYIQGVSKAPLTPELWVSYTKRRTKKRYDFKQAFLPEEYSGIGEMLNIRIGDNLLFTDGHNYFIKVKNESISYDISIKPGRNIRRIILTNFANRKDVFQIC